LSGKNPLTVKPDKNMSGKIFDIMAAEFSNGGISEFEQAFRAAGRRQDGERPPRYTLSGAPGKHLLIIIDLKSEIKPEKTPHLVPILRTPASPVANPE
jgi:hypothetical protein